MDEKTMSHKSKLATWEKIPVKKPSAEMSETGNGNCKRFTGETLLVEQSSIQIILQDIET